MKRRDFLTSIPLLGSLPFFKDLGAIAREKKIAEFNKVTESIDLSKTAFSGFIFVTGRALYKPTKIMWPKCGCDD